jgi:hypothetical protein
MPGFFILVSYRTIGAVSIGEPFPEAVMLHIVSCGIDGRRLDHFFIKTGQPLCKELV